MNAEEKRGELSDDSFTFPDIDSSPIDSDYILGESSTENYDLHGIQRLISSDSEEDENLQECIVVGSAYIQDGFENEENNNIVTLNLLDEDSGENYEQGCSKFNGKKRVATPLGWKRNIVKAKRAKGEGIVSLRGKIVQKRTTGVDCKCKSECFKQFTDEQKKLTINIFNNILNKEKQDTFLGGLIITNNVARHRPVNNSKQTFAFHANPQGLEYFFLLFE